MVQRTNCGFSKSRMMTVLNPSQMIKVFNPHLDCYWTIHFDELACDLLGNPLAHSDHRGLDVAVQQPGCQE